MQTQFNTSVTDVFNQGYHLGFHAGFSEGMRLPASEVTREEPFTREELQFLSHILSLNIKANSQYRDMDKQSMNMYFERMELYGFNNKNMFALWSEYKSAYQKRKRLVNKLANIQHKVKKFLGE